MNSRRRMQVYRASHWLHWTSAAICLAALLLFSITGITLNHAAAIGGKPQVISGEAQLPQPLRGLIAGTDARTRLPEPLADWMASQFDIDTGDASVEWSEEELYVSAPGPGRDAWVSVDRATGAAKFERTDRGWVAYFNDLHKGRNTGIVWWCSSTWPPRPACSSPSPAGSCCRSRRVSAGPPGRWLRAASVWWCCS